MTSPVISLQLWTVRDELVADADATLARLAEIGFRRVEAFDFVSRADELAAAFARNGIVAETGHASLASDVENPFDNSIVPPSLDEVFAAATKLGMTTVIDPFVAGERWTTRDDIAETARRLNEAAVVAATHGIVVGYHNHDHELLNRVDGRFALEVFADLLDPAVVLEVDLYWAAAGGAEIVSLVERLGDRVVALHVKDGTLDPRPSTGTVPTDQVPAGEGAVALTAALDAAHAARYAIVEFDAYPGDIWAAITTSYEFLTARGLS